MFILSGGDDKNDATDESSARWMTSFTNAVSIVESDDNDAVVTCKKNTNQSE
jgi:hypothetical protein